MIASNYEWLLLASLLFVVGGIILSVWEEWAKSGLTDTSVLSLLLWLVGLLGFTAWGLLVHASAVALIGLVPAGVFAWWLLLKWRDRTRRRRR